jgi:hypothetical protein
MGEFENASDLPSRLKEEIEQFFLSATFFTDKNAQECEGDWLARAEGGGQADQRQPDW